ncbi:SRPBCC family protein [Streptomyces sp. NBC_01511]|uniref:SRPBCC family protein n=1 Tax=unclassified Streptomyces TaxID=2593676 RepID=UPI003870AF09
MAVYNLHRRAISATARTPEELGRLLDSLASPDDALWPHDRWPRMRLDRPLGVGAAGGHGPIRYTVVAHTPGRWVRFRFSGPRGFHGFHEYTVESTPNGVVLHHLLTMRLRGAARFTWPLVWRRLHDALIEDSLDRAEGVRRSQWIPYVRMLRRALSPR